MSTAAVFGGPQPYSPSLGSGGQIQPGAITYTTSTGPDGETIYHPFKAVPASYQTPQGVVRGIQWIPAEATSILPQGAQPANDEFAESWRRDREVDKWQRSEEKRRKKEEKESIRRLSKQFEKDREENEVRIHRERRRSFYGDAPPPPSYAPSHGAYTHSPSSELDRKFNDLDLDGRTSAYGNRPRKYSMSGGDRTYNAPPAEAGYGTSVAYSAAGPTSPYRQSAYTTSPNIRPQETSMYPGGPDPITRAASPFARGNDPIARAASPYGRPPTEPIARAASPYGRPPTEPIARASSPYHPGFVPRAPSPVPPRAPSPYSAAHSPYVARAPSPYAKPPPPHLGRAPSPYLPPQVSQMYPPGHVMEGQPMSRSRAPSPMPGPPVAFPTSPRMPVSVSTMDQQLSAPDAFSRPANAAQPYTPFGIMKIQDMEQFYDQIPRMPLVLDTHDVYHQDWIRFMNDLALGWAGKLPLTDLSRGPPPRRSLLVADLVDLWNDSFFLPRRVEVILFKGHERRSGPNKGVIDYQLPGFEDYDSDDTSSSSTSSDSESDLYPGYGRGVDLAESKRRIKEKVEKKLRKKEKKARRKAKEREKTYALYITYVPPRDPAFGYYP
ncbi:hypothetical protein F5J12DRAFT_793793 [Pisolithus orientalis]|uniref:uncharacterized protein n=1 Tax=Pisolithus orientalis TaxID=936130 RepID=UPI0022259E85|nr:uncharacterized protein F5J12DRAFT_793793 [Pisolithus orientalis]KAI6035491.1 hypothetical protein F5J12DRAFT_793793 [Pisolithus orientalis]